MVLGIKSKALHRRGKSPPSDLSLQPCQFRTQTSNCQARSQELHRPAEWGPWSPATGPLREGHRLTLPTKHHRPSTVCVPIWRLKHEVLGPPTPSNTYLLCARPSTVFYMILTGGEAVLLFTSFPGQAHPSWVLVLVHSCKQGMLRHFSLGLNFLLYKLKLRILDVSPLLRKGKMLNVVAGNPREPRCGSGWIRAIQPLFREVAQGDSGWLSYSAAVQRNGLCGRLMGFWEWGRVSHRVTFKLFSEQTFLTLSRELERW